MPGSNPDLAEQEVSQAVKYLEYPMIGSMSALTYLVAGLFNLHSACCVVPNHATGAKSVAGTIAAEQRQPRQSAQAAAVEPPSGTETPVAAPEAESVTGSDTPPAGEMSPALPVTTPAPAPTTVTAPTAPPSKVPLVTSRKPVTVAPQKTTATPAAAPEAPQSPPLVLTVLEQRLRDTDAIGLFTKITLKNQVDDLVKRFKEYYGGNRTTTLPQLRQSYDQLLAKVHELLKSGDPALAGAVMNSRESIWSVLADPVRFAKLQ